MEPTVGRRGPAPEPVRLRMLKGETRPSQVNRRAPEPRPDRPVMPADMDDAAQVVWQRVEREVGATGIITAGDTDTLRCYCEAVAQYVAALALLRTSGLLIRRRDDLVKNPLHQVVRDHRDAIRLFARELGLTPSARSSLVAPEKVKDDPVAAWEGSG